MLNGCRAAGLQGFATRLRSLFLHFPVLRKIFLGGSYKGSFESGSFSYLCLSLPGRAEKGGGSYKWLRLVVLQAWGGGG